MKESLQGQHYNMAAIVANGWSYSESITRGRWKSVCQFNTDNLFTYTEKERKCKKSFYDYMSDKKIRDNKIDSCLSEDPKLKNGKNTVIENIFKSYLIRPETETILNVLGIEEKFLSLLKRSKNLTNRKMLSKKENENIVRDYISLQYIRTPLFYRFLLDDYFQRELKKITSSDKVDTYPLFFKALTLLDNVRIKNFIDFANERIIFLYKDYRKKLNDCILVSYENKMISNYLGDMSAFNFNFERFGINRGDAEKYAHYSRNKFFLDNCTYTPTTSSSFVLAIKPEKKYKSKKKLRRIITDKFEKIILSIIKKGIHNQILFIYSKYIVCHPKYRQILSKDIKNFFDINNLENFYNNREEEIAYLKVLEQLLIDFKEKEKLFRVF